MRMYGRRRKLTAEETEHNRKAKEAREAAAMTCQCCGRKHLANRGWIAHHAYQRPGDGWQTASCMGAKALPFEVDCTKLGELIAILKSRRISMIDIRHAVKTEIHPITLTHSFIDWQSSGRMGYKRDRVERTAKFVVTRANWNSVYNAEDNSEIFDGKYGRWESFDVVKANDLAYRDTMIANITDHINEQTKRYEGWKQTHKWNAETETWEGV